MFGALFGRKKAQEGDDRLATISRRLDDVESAARTLKAEWYDVLDRLERIAGRLAKRAERDGKAQGLLTGEAAASPQGAPALSPAMLAVMRRRAPRASPTNANGEG